MFSFFIKRRNQLDYKIVAPSQIHFGSIYFWVFFLKPLQFFDCFILLSFCFKIVILIIYQSKIEKFQSEAFLKGTLIKKMNNFTHIYDPPYFLHKINNYEKAVYERKGHWTEKEKVKYGVFLQIFRDKFQDRENPILNKIFRVMSDFMKTRNHNQCRSHHQKMQRERFQIDSILDSIKSKYHPREYQLFFEKYSRHIKSVNVDTVLNQKGYTPHKCVEKRKKIKMNQSQSKLTNQEPKRNDNLLPFHVNKIENIEQNSEVLKSVIDDGKLLKELKIKMQKQNGSEIQICSKGKEQHIQEPIPQQNNNILTQVKGCDKNQNALKKTGLEYDSDYDIVDEKSKVAYVQIPMNPPITQQKLNLGHSLHIGGISPQFINTIPHLATGPHHLVPNFESYQNIDLHQPQSYRVPSSSFGYEQNYTVSLKDLEQRKKWHLSEASRLCAQMNEHLQGANTCEQMRQMMVKQMTQLRRGYYYPNGYSNTHF